MFSSSGDDNDNDDDDNGDDIDGGSDTTMKYESKNDERI